MHLPRRFAAVLAVSAAVLVGVVLLVALTTGTAGPADDGDPAGVTEDAGPVDDGDSAGVTEASDPSDAVGSADDADSAATTTATADGRPVGFDVVTLRSAQPDGTVEEWCVWHAETRGQRAQGLQEVTSLGHPIGMAFSYDAPSDNTYHMHNTRLPLSIAWFGEDGSFVGATNMVPCAEEDRSDCARYTPGEEYTLAVEVPMGALRTYGLVPDSTAELLDQPCP